MNSRFTGESLSWRKLCRAAALEKDPYKLSQIVNKINSALRSRQRSLAEDRRDNISSISSRLDRAA
jgi:hypothetical protein